MSKIEHDVFHAQSLVVDGHCDTVYLLENENYNFAEHNDIGHVDMARLKEGGVDVQVFALYQEPRYKPVGAMKRAMVLLHRLTGEIENNPDKISLAKSFPDIREACRQGKIAALLSIEGGDALEGEAEMLEVFYTLGVRALGLTWNNRNELADGVAEDAAGGGLTSLGRRVVQLCDRKNILLDLAHLSAKGFNDVIHLSGKPVIVSHANAHALCPHRRNLTDAQLRLLRDKDGLVGITFYPPFIREGEASLDDLLDHFAYIADLIGPEYVGIGSDFDGINKTLPELGDVSKMPRLTEGLFKKGFSPKEVQDILGQNFLRVLEKTI